MGEITSTALTWFVFKMQFFIIPAEGSIWLQTRLVKPDKSIKVCYSECSLTQDSQIMKFITNCFWSYLEKSSWFPDKVSFATPADVQELFLFQNRSSLKKSSFLVQMTGLKRKLSIAFLKVLHSFQVSQAFPFTFIYLHKIRCVHNPVFLPGRYEHLGAA